MTREGLIRLVASTIDDATCAILTDHIVQEAAKEVVSAIEDAQRGQFKRANDPRHDGCTYRSGGDCASLGVRLHCRLAADHQPLGHDFVLGPAPTFEPDQCACYTGTGQDEAGGHVAYVCGEPRAAHGQPHAMEVSGPYVLKVEGRA